MDLGGKASSRHCQGGRSRNAQCYIVQRRLEIVPHWRHSLVGCQPRKRRSSSPHLTGGSAHAHWWPCMKDGLLQL